MRNEEWRWRLRRIIKMGDARHFCQLNYFSPFLRKGQMSGARRDCLARM